MFMHHYFPAQYITLVFYENVCIFTLFQSIVYSQCSVEVQLYIKYPSLSLSGKHSVTNTIKNKCRTCASVFKTLQILAILLANSQLIYRRKINHNRRRKFLNVLFTDTLGVNLRCTLRNVYLH